MKYDGKNHRRFPRDKFSELTLNKAEKENKK